MKRPWKEERLLRDARCTPHRYWHFFDGSDFTEHATADRTVHLRERPFTQGGMRLVHGSARHARGDASGRESNETVPTPLCKRFRYRLRGA